MAESIFATDIGLGIKEKKQFVLNRQVSQPVLKFNSSAPVEDIEGIVEDPLNIISDFNLDPSNIESSNGKISFKIKGLKTGISMRDEHMQSEEWLFAEKYPDIKFVLKGLKNVEVASVKKSAGKSVFNALATGTYSMRGKSKNYDIPVNITYIKASDKTALRTKGDLLFVDGNFRIALKDFNVEGSKGIVGNKVGESIVISFKLFYSSN